MNEVDDDIRFFAKMMAIASIVIMAIAYLIAEYS